MVAQPTQPQIIVTSETPDFRQQARQHITPEDLFLEIGCSFGACTRLLGELACTGVAIDHGADAVTKTRQLVAAYPAITVAQVDARDIAHLHSLCPEPTVILLDVGGNEALEKVTALLRLILKTFCPRLILVKSIELAELAAIIQDYTLPNQPHLLAPFEETALPRQLLELSHSPVMNDRLFALQRLRHAANQHEVLQRIEELCQDESPTVRRQAKHALKHARHS